MIRAQRVREQEQPLAESHQLPPGLHDLGTMELYIFLCSYVSALGLISLFRCMVWYGGKLRLVESGLPANQMILTVIVVFSAWHHLIDTILQALGNKSGSFCEAVNCEQSEQEGKFLFATSVDKEYV